MRSLLTRRFHAVVCSSILLSAIAVAQSMVEPQIVTPVPPPSPSANEAKVPEGAPSALNLDRARIRIGAGDLLDVSVYGVSDFHQEVRVNETGKISLPLIGDVHLGGSTVEEAERVITKSLVEGSYFRDPHVIVVIKDFASQGVSVLGEVAHPGIYPMVGTRRLFDLVSAAGGFSSKAGKTVSITHRDQPMVPDRITLSEDPTTSAASNVQIFPGDTIVVSKAGIIYVVGDVHRPGGFVMENNERMTVLEAIALAQGPNRTAALGSARILRRTPTGPSEVKIPLKQIMAAKSNDMDMNPDDILFIPGSAAKSAFARGAEGVFQVATGLAVYGVH
jgi:polysaccharide biosynthesis/export protein